MDYEVELEATRLEGTDTICVLTVPVGNTACSCAVYSGTCVVLNTVDGADLGTIQYGGQNGRWYHLRVRVTTTAIEVWVDRRRIVGLQTAGHAIDTTLRSTGPLGLVELKRTDEAEARPTPRPDPAALTKPLTLLASPLLIEAERAHLRIAPMDVARDPTASGGAFVWERESGVPGRKTVRAQVVFFVSVSRDRTAYLWARVRSPSQDSDSFYVAVVPGRRTDAAKLLDWHLGIRKSWEWRPFAPHGSADERARRLTRIPLEAGANSIIIASREDGTALDRIALTTTPKPPAAARR